MNSTSLAGRSILIVEDEALIALDVADAFERAGAHVTTASTYRAAVALVEQDGLSAAILDHALESEDSSRLRERLKERDVPFVIYTGFDKVREIGHDGVVVSKPANPAVLVATVEGLLQGRSSGT